MNLRSISSVLGVIALSLFFTTRGSFAFMGTGSPSVVITGVGATQFYVGQELTIQSTLTDPAGISRVDLLVDGSVVSSGRPSTPITNFATVQTWKATVGSHTLVVRSVNTANQSSDSAPVTVTVVPLPGATPLATRPPAASSAGSRPPVANGPCMDNAELVTDVAIAGGTALNPGQAFNKDWRVRNTGTCTWDTTYLLSFVGGEAMSPWTAFLVPNTPPGETVDLAIPLTAPTARGSHSGQWQLQNQNGTPFGPLLRLLIQVTGTGPTLTPVPGATLTPAPGAAETSAPSPSGCSGTPVISSFEVSPSTINAGESATLSWGLVSNADSVEIDQGIGGVVTPGDISVSPSSTTTYTLTAFCGSTTATSQVTLTVNTGATATPTATLTTGPSGPTATRTRTSTPSSNLVPAGPPEPTRAP